MHFFNVGVAELVYASVSEADEFFSCEFKSHHLHQAYLSKKDKYAFIFCFCIEKSFLV